MFFYQDAVSVASGLNLPPSDEPQLLEQWSQLANEANIELQACVAASLRRGVVDLHESKEHGLSACNLDSAFQMTGLGQLAASISSPSAKLIHFK